MQAFQWFHELSARERRTLYAVDAFDFMIYSFLIPSLIAAWGMSKSEAGMIATSSLISSAVGGWLAGILADRYGRVRVLQWTIATFALFTFLSGYTHSFWQLLATRTLQGFGFGGEWSVVTIMMAETIRSSEHRAKAVGTVQSSWSFGWAAAAVLYWAFFALLPEQYAWRACFWIGIVPALWILYIRRNVSDPDIYVAARRARERGIDRAHFLQIFDRAHLRTTLFGSALCTGMLGGYYAITTWLPTYLKTVRHLSVFNTSGYLIVLIVGSFVGYLVGACLSDRIGRRASFVLFAAGSFSLGMAYTMLPITDAAMLLLGFPLGIVVQGIFAGVGAYLSELYPGAIRGSGQGFCYNLGRGIGSFFPILVGSLSQSMSLVKAIGLVAGSGYLLVIVAALVLPETKGKSLVEHAEAAR
ncbi:MFS transporter [Burkholderia oklahomensis]|uniref:MFS transporter n=1 Tax=Burkholderia oklahomensis TaxID=342113 RepID=UPI00016A78C9|nr:MFS transporter [Burkholderia oklahomensis]AJX33643.1 sugar (and other) transporter family protein [Burkholderia oklahomensis C6786]AOI44649.1 MFS transporter [Burkholderia oklahomensis C6786]KUY58055.1 MFS transporter [Burkholderia oklahomensis C6786]MBI0359349.1 MFS transporter [Burkholderia oklahomensis]SUW58344.1 Putative niacin/nicotinamide transporter NaiP [Burkholderia oklahomensis]